MFVAKEIVVDGEVSTNVPVFSALTLIEMGVDEAAAQAMYDELLAVSQAEGLQERLMALADHKHKDAYVLFLGYKATDMQIARYKDKYERAKAGEFDVAVNKAIIGKFEAMTAAIRGFTDLIEMFREFVSDLIVDGEFGKAEIALKEGRGFGATTKPEDVQALLAGLGG